MLRPSNAHRKKPNECRQKFNVNKLRLRLSRAGWRNSSGKQQQQLVDVIAATTPVLFVSEGFRW